MRDIYVCVIFLRVKIYWMFFYWSHFFDVNFSYCEVFMCQVLGVTLTNIFIHNMKKLVDFSVDFLFLPMRRGRHWAMPPPIYTSLITFMAYYIQTSY